MDLEDVERYAEVFPRIVSLDWCVYSIKDNKVTMDSSVVIKPSVHIDN